LEELARRISKSIGIGLHPVVMAHPEITIDADEAEDHQKRVGRSAMEHD
jgi:hypothetical protein